MGDVQNSWGGRRNSPNCSGEWRPGGWRRVPLRAASRRSGSGQDPLGPRGHRPPGGPATTLEARARPLGATASFGLWADALERHLRRLGRDEISELCGGYVDDLASLLRSVAALRGRAPDDGTARGRGCSPASAGCWPTWPGPTRSALVLQRRAPGRPVVVGRPSLSRRSVRRRADARAGYGPSR